MNDFTRFIKYELSYAIHDHLKAIFGLDFKKLGNGKLICNTYLDGSKSDKADKLAITVAEPWRIIQNSSMAANDGGGVSISFIDLFCQENGLNPNSKSDTFKAVKELCEICGIQCPEFTEEALRAFKEREEKQQKIKSIADRMNAQLLGGSEAAAPVYLYLTEVRRYTRPFIEWAGLGFVTPQDAQELRELMGTTFPAKVGESYLLAIPERSRGEITGFRFRNMGRDGDKYKAVFIGGNETNRFHLYGFEPGDIPVRDGLKDLLVVEGQLDALRLKYEDIPGVVAIGRDGISDEAIQEVKEYGVQSFTLLFDRDVDENGRHKNNSRGIENAVGRVRAAGLCAFVASFPDENGQKVDADEYMKRHTGAEFLEIVAARKSAVMYFFDQTARKYKGENYDNMLTDPEREAFRAEVIGLCSRTGTTPIERRTMAELFARYLGGGITPEDVVAEIAEFSSLQDIATAKERKVREREELGRLKKRLEYVLGHEGDEDPLVWFHGEVQKMKKRLDIEEEEAGGFKEKTVRDYREDIKNRPAGLHTGIFLYDSYDVSFKRELTIPVGQLTYIVAATGHGKSRFMENLALTLAQQEGEGDVVYLSLEMPDSMVYMRMMNLFINQRDLSPSMDNSEYLEKYLSEGKDEIPGVALNKKIKEFDKLISDKKLRIYYPSYDILPLIENVMAQHHRRPIKALFIDYVQMLRTPGNFGSKKEMITQICLSLMPMAVKSNIPVVLGAQFNREVHTPVDMALQKIADASDIEHSANVALMLFSSNDRIRANAQHSSWVNGYGNLTPAAEDLVRRGFQFGIPGKMYVELGKNRNGRNGLNAVLDFEGSTGKIQNSSDDRGPRVSDARNIVVQVKPGEDEVRALRRTADNVLKKRKAEMDKLKADGVEFSEGAEKKLTDENGYEKASNSKGLF